MLERYIGARDSEDISNEQFKPLKAAYKKAVQSHFILVFVDGNEVTEKEENFNWALLKALPADDDLRKKILADNRSIKGVKLPECPNKECRQAEVDYAGRQCKEFTNVRGCSDLAQKIAFCDCFK